MKFWDVVDPILLGICAMVIVWGIIVSAHQICKDACTEALNEFNSLKEKTDDTSGSESKAG